MTIFKNLLYHRIWNLLCQNEHRPAPPSEIACDVPPVKVAQLKLSLDIVHVFGHLRLNNAEEIPQYGNYTLTTQGGKTYQLSLGEETIGFTHWENDETSCYHVFGVEEYNDNHCVLFAVLVCDECFYRIAAPYSNVAEQLEVLEKFFYCRPAKEWSRFPGAKDYRKSIFHADEWELVRKFFGDDVFAKSLLAFLSYYATAVSNTLFSRVDTALWKYERFCVCDEDQIQTFLSLVPRLGLCYEDVQYTFSADDVVDPEETAWQRLLVAYAILHHTGEYSAGYTLVDAICDDVISGREPALIACKADIRKLAIPLANKAKASEKARGALFEIMLTREQDFTPKQHKKICEGLFAGTDDPMVLSKAINTFSADSCIWEYIYKTYGIQMIGYGKS